MQDNKKELEILTPLLAELGYRLDAKQPHISGERTLMGPIGGGRKLVLLATDAHGTRVVIKASNDPKAIEEMEHERVCRDFLEKIKFAYEVFSSPKELLHARRRGYTVVVTKFIEQDTNFLDRPTKEQFGLALRAFKAQEGAHATTYEHARAIQSTFGEMRAKDYIEKLSEYARVTGLPEALAFVEKHKETLEQYSGFLTHWDFTPHNIRVRGECVYLLDHSSLRFGNKYEGWARFINFMELYNPPLARALIQYVKDNRTREESESLRVMRVYRLVELIRYYHSWLPRTEGNLHDLAKARISFWTQVLETVLSSDDAVISESVVLEYKKTRDALRSEEEKERQRGLH